MVKMSNRCANMVTTGLWATSGANNYSGTSAPLEQSTNYVCTWEGEAVLHGQAECKLFEHDHRVPCQLGNSRRTMQPAMKSRIPLWKGHASRKATTSVFLELPKFNDERSHVTTVVQHRQHEL